jgi:Domain of unknown function DUF29
MQITTLYEQDFYSWTQQQTVLLRSGKLAQLDVENLIEEIESLGKQERRELENRLGVLLGHLLKWHYQPDARSKSWFYTIKEQQNKINRLLAQNPSLKPYLPEAITFGYEDGLLLVGKETPLDPSQLPQSCPFSNEDIFEQPIEFDPG